MADKDLYASHPRRPEHLGRRGAVVTPSDSADLPEVAKTIVMLDGAGDLSVIPAENADADVINFVGLSVGATVPFQVRRVRATGTSGTFAAVYE